MGPGMAEQQMVAFGIAGLIVVAVTFLPGMIAYARRHPDRALIAKLNILALLSFLLWLALMIWVLGGTRNDAVINRFVHSRAQRPLLIGLLVVLVGGGALTSAHMVGLLPG